MTREKLEYKEYEYELDAADVCYDLKHQIEDGSSTYICDAISQESDSNVDIYNSELWRTADEFSEYSERAIKEGFVDLKSTTLVKIFQAGQYLYYNDMCYNNLKSIYYNIFVDMYNEEDNDLLDGVEDIESDLEELADRDYDETCELRKAFDQYLEGLKDE